MNWLDAQADGIAFMLAVFTGVAAMLLLALVVEWWKGREMRRRKRVRAAYERYCALLDEEARRFAAHCWKGPEARS